MLAEERRQLLLEVLREHGTLETGIIAQRLGVSDMTIRRDWQVLQRQGLLTRVHGGARATREDELAISLLSNYSVQAKRQIGRLAAAQVQDGETIFLDAGITCLEVARELKGRKLRGVSVLTHAVNIAAELSSSPHLAVIQLGGEICSGTFSATGPATVTALQTFSFDRMFLGAVGLHPRFGVTSVNLLEGEVKWAVLRRSAWVALLLDSSKWGRQAPLRVAGLERLDLLISDAALPAGARAQLEEAGVRVLTG